jgi:MFS family permease
VFRWVVGLALLADTVPQERLTEATGWLTLGMSLGMLVSPLLGGVVYDKAGYNAVFGMCYALIGVDIVLRLLLVEKKVAARWNEGANEHLPVTANSVPEESPMGDMAPSSTNLAPEDGSEKAAQQDGRDLEAHSNSTPHRRQRDRLPPVLSLLYSRRLLASLFCALIQAMLLTSFDSGMFCSLVKMIWD